ncbi:uncharacterized protein LOC108675901 isoform X2 [Hyalella azteca]|uniref:Uncharacterized protein LOC108675901 isoform X2 n=1 Tax=Hyalella azteca TaxID=294128 RepID=A0A8B7P0G0_HYAAZ|nr:uncharacterized protein LOC108675901 isoform X2 [Hyalella azteca]
MVHTKNNFKDQNHDLPSSENDSHLSENHSGTSHESVHNLFVAVKTSNSRRDSEKRSVGSTGPSIIRVIRDGIFYYLCIVTRGARGAVEVLITDVSEVSWWLVRLCLSEQTFTQFHEQWQVFSSGASTSPEDEPLEKRRRRRCFTFVRFLGSLLPLAPVQRPYLRFVSLNSLSTSNDSLFEGSVRSVRTAPSSNRQPLSIKPAALEQSRHQLLRAEGMTNLSRESNESGFSTAHYFDSDTSSCVDNEQLDDDTEGDRQSITSAHSMAVGESSGKINRRKSQIKRRHGRRTEHGFHEAQQRESNLESALPFTDPSALEKIKSLESQLEQLKLTISQIMQQKHKPPTTPPSSPTGTRRPSVVPPPPPPPPTPIAPPPPPPPLPPTPLAAGVKSVAGGSLHELLKSKQGQLSKTEVSTTPKDEPGSWSSVVNAIKGGGAKLKKVQRRSPSVKKTAVETNSGDAYRAALAATLRQRFKSVHGSEDDTDVEYSDSDAVKGRWDSEAWQSPPCNINNNTASGQGPLPQLLFRDKLKKRSPVKLAKEIKNSPDMLLAAVNEKLFSSVNGERGSDSTLIFSTPKSSFLDNTEDQAPDSNELFRKFLQSDRKRRVIPPSLTKIQSTPNLASFSTPSLNKDRIETILETPQSCAAAGEDDTPVLNSTLKPRALSFSTEVQQSPFGQHLLRRRSTISLKADAAKETRPSHDTTLTPAANREAKRCHNEETPVASGCSKNNSEGLTIKKQERAEIQEESLYLSFESCDKDKRSLQVPNGSVDPEKE